MTVCITGDVHHMSMETRDQTHLEVTEVEAAIKYARIAAEHNIPITLFCTGKCAIEEPERMERLASMDNVEIGGHNYWGFTTPVHSAWRVVQKTTGGRIGSWNGPKRFQAYEIDKTINVLESVGATVKAWRDHAYRHDRNTAQLLGRNGITHFSDVVDPNGRIQECNDLILVPINTPPDHEHIYHSFRSPEFVKGSDFNGPFGSKSVEPNEWVNWVLSKVDEHKKRNRVSTVLAHPACLQIASDMDAFQTLCQSIESDTINIRSCTINS